jgi:signal transduction histidine kinase
MDEAISGDASILYVEDDSSTRLQVTHLLKQHGYSCLVAEDGQQGLELYHQQAPDIVLTDIVMPVMDGLEMARQIRADNPTVQFIFFTAFDNRENMLASIDIGVSQFVVKPMDPANLISAIQYCINLHNWRAQYQNIKHLEAINILAGGMAHDFNNLLQGILGYVDLAKKKAEPGSKTLHLLELIEPSSNQAIKLSQQLLNLADLGLEHRGEKQLTPLIKSTVHTVLNNSQISCEFDLPPDLPTVICDEKQIRKVIHHLAENACESMPEGGALRISAEVRHTEEQSNSPLASGDYLFLTFDDTGRGILPENLRRIFEPYFSTKDMSTRKGQGLGLAVCHSIINRHGGILTAKSKSGEGATISLCLPVTPGTAV